MQLALLAAEVAFVTAPREVLAHRTYLLTRRCTQRQFLLRPDAYVTQAFLYCLGAAAERYGISVHGWIAMSNHEHLLVRDNRGNLPEFLAYFHKLIAKTLNVHWDRAENFWAAEQPSAVYLPTRTTRFEKLIYLLVNPVADDLVERAVDWPGASSLAQHLSGRPLKVQRPRGFFRSDGRMPRDVALQVERPEGYEELSDEAWSNKVFSAVRDAEEKARTRRALRSQRVLGRKAVLRAAHTDQPGTAAPRGGLRPLVACDDVDRRARELLAIVQFRRAHRDARLRWCAGDRGAVFPPGTYLMRRVGVACAPVLRAGSPTSLS